MTLNPDQQKAVESGGPVAVNVGGTASVLVRRDIYLRLDPDYDAGPWTVEEMNLLADQAEAMISERESHEGCCPAHHRQERSRLFPHRSGDA